jgi:hypothetical protein
VNLFQPISKIGSTFAPESLLRRIVTVLSYYQVDNSTGHSGSVLGSKSTGPF